jgi:hypothetical protein
MDRRQETALLLAAAVSVFTKMCASAQLIWIFSI